MVHETTEYEDDDDLLERILETAPPHLRELIENAPENDPPRAAYHEAGHAVVAVRLQLPITAVCIMENEFEQWEGETVIEWEGSASDVERESGTVLPFIAAGPFAQLQWVPRADPQAWIHDEHDAARILRALDESQDQRVARCEAAKHTAAVYVETWWDAIKAVANRLIKTRCLSRGELLEMVSP